MIMNLYSPVKEYRGAIKDNAPSFCMKTFGKAANIYILWNIEMLRDGINFIIKKSTGKSIKGDIYYNQQR